MDKLTSKVEQFMCGCVVDTVYLDGMAYAKWKFCQEHDGISTIRPAEPELFDDDQDPQPS